MNFKKIFSSFPVIDVQFNYVTIDAMAIQEDNGLFYSPYLNYLMVNEKTGKVEVGFVLQTGATFSTYLELAEFVYDLASSGFFLQPLGNQGRIYNESMELITTLNWGEYLNQLEFEDQKSDDEDEHTRTKRVKPTIH